MVWKNDQVSEQETEKIVELAKKSIMVEGDFVELGCYKGDTSLLLADILVGGEKKLERLLVEGKVGCTGKGKGQSGKWRFDLSQVLQHCRPA